MNAHPHHNTPPAADNDTAPLEAVTGTVESIDINSGEQVKYGQVLLRFVKD